jgi:ribokinase
MGSICALGPADVTDAFLASARHLHYGSFFLHTGLQPHVPGILRRARALGLSVSLDTNWDPTERWNSTVAEALSLIDIFMPNDREALCISGRRTLGEAAAHFYAQGVPVVAIKRGAEGATVYAGQERHACAVVPATEGDRVGAGDSFDAGFLAGWLRGLPLDRCLEIACQCGRSVASAIGGLRGQPTWEQISSL